MTRTISLAVDIDADANRIFDVLSTAEGQRSFWTADCDVSDQHGRFGFAAAPMDLEVDVVTRRPELVQMTVTSGFPFWEGSIWEWQLGAAARAASGTGVLFRHRDFADGYLEIDIAHTAQTWALVLDRLSRFLTSGAPDPLFPAG